MTDLCLAGWQQPFDSLAALLPEAVHFDYGAYDNLRAMFADLPKEPRLAVGWSLGGQLLARAVADGYMRPRRLILLAAPFQWVAGDGFPQGFPPEGIDKVRGSYVENPEAMLKNLNALVALGDTKERQITRSLNATVKVWKNGMYWLDKLTYASCLKFDFSLFPPTTVVHGLKDKVIYPVNAEAFAKAMPGAELVLWPDCAHAPHLHDLATLQKTVSAHV